MQHDYVQHPVQQQQSLQPNCSPTIYEHHPQVSLHQDGPDQLMPLPLGQQMSHFPGALDHCHAALSDGKDPLDLLPPVKSSGLA